VWNTGDPGQINYTASNTTLAITGEIDVMNYYDPADTCPTDIGSNCPFNYSPNLDLSVLAKWIGYTSTSLGGGYYTIVLDFETTGGTDITWTDPSDGDSVMLEASWVAGTLFGEPTPGLQVNATWCDGVGGCGPQGVVGDPLVFGSALIDGGSLYASLFDSGSGSSVMLDLSEYFNTDPDINTIAAYLLANDELPDFTGEGQGQLYRLETSDFVIPEPSTALLLGLGVFGLAASGRRRTG
jgi:hypothetical protein